MQKQLSTLLVVLIFSAPSLAQTSTDNVWATIMAMDMALTKKDSATLKTLLTDDFIGAIPSGKSFTKIDYIRYHCKPGIGLVALDEYPVEQASIRLHENTAVVNRRVRARVKKPDGSVGEFDVQRLEVCYKEKNGWRVASGQGTEVNLTIRP